MITGMFYSTYYLWGDDLYTTSDHYNLPPGRNVIAEICLASLNGTEVFPGFTHVEWLDERGVPRHDDFSPSAMVVARNQMTRIDWSVSVRNTDANYLVNLFYWDTPVA
jgi:hypothetical protein